MVALVIAVAVLAVAVIALAFIGGGLGATRKMIGAAVAPWLALPLAEWITSGAVDVDAASKAVLSTILALVTYWLPNAAPEEGR